MVPASGLCTVEIVHFYLAPLLRLEIEEKDLAMDRPDAHASLARRAALP